MVGLQQQKNLSEQASRMSTQCPFCSVQCKMEVIEEQAGDRKTFRVLPVYNPASQGRLCIKGVYGHQHALHPDRVLYPMRKVNGEFVRISWPDALELIREQFTQIQQEDGLDALGVYGAATVTNEVAYLLGKFARVALKTKYIDYNGRYCMSAAASAGMKAFGMDRGLTMELTDIPYSQCIILAGTNIAECQPTLIPYFTKAKENGCYIIIIDPRETGTTKLADLHLKVKPGMDAALVNGLLKVIWEEGYSDPSFIAERTKGFEELKEHLSTIDLDDIEEITGIPVEQIQQAARLFGQSKTGMVFTARGVEQHTDGHMIVRNFMNLSLITGKIGKKGSGYGAITGQGNGQGAREQGHKADQLPGYRSIEDPDHRAYIAKVWGVHEKDIPGKGVSAYEMLEKVHQKEITGLFVMCSNPVVSSPNASLVEEGLNNLKFLVVVDLFVSESARMADLILPASSYLENEGTMTNVEGRVTWRPGSRECPGEAKHDWQILCEMARVLGKEKHFSFSSAGEIFNELRVASRGGIADYYGITYDRIKQEDGVYWPCPSLDHPGEGRLFEKTFANPDGKAEIIAVANHFPKEQTDENFPLYLTTGRVMYHYLTGVQTRRSPSLKAREKESFLEIHPNTANKFGIEDAILVKVESRRGSMVVRSKVTESIREDTVFLPMHWGDLQNVNKLTHQELDPVCKMPGFKVCAVRVGPLNK
ncbi:molybdopterin oxidoreductase family protein [Ammoniphilus sp. YIM 78166]|uniref:assimilatory nitrate reductase catalytic subunit NasC n=1 Tax=Ammoniphilus sp. YIM 78166 TaxID=1644106 RepID=UPI001F0F7C46|nr:nitrate reductase [Ammoniphilus sp. YIM 78166]